MALPIFSITWLLVVVAALNLGTLPSVWVWILGLAILVALSRLHNVLVPVAAGSLVALITLATALHDLHASQLRTSQISTDLQLIVRVSDVPVHTSYGVRFSVDVVSCESCQNDFGPRRLLLSGYGSSARPAAGELWSMTVRLKPVGSLRNPGSFDRAQWALTKQLHAQGYVRKTPVAYRLQEAPLTSVAAIREALSERLRQLPSATRAVALVEALTLGIKSGIDQQTWHLLRDTGTSHLMAISGLHVTLLAGWAYWGARFLLRHLTTALWLRRLMPGTPDIHTGALLCSILMAFGYALLAGFALPVQRAMLMLLVWVAASWRFRHLSPTTGLSLALVVVLAGNVFSPLSAGMWLSFGTVAAIFYLHRGRQIGRYDTTESEGHLTAYRLRILQQVKGAGRTHVLLGLVLLPMSAWFFQSASLAAPVANLLAVPFVGFIVVPLCFITVLISLVADAPASVLLMVTQWSIELLMQFLRWVALPEFSSVTLGIPSAGAMVFCMLGVVVFFAPRGCGLRWFAVPLILPALLFNVQRSPVDGFEVHLLDVGQGLAALVLTDDHTTLFDTGGKLSSTSSMFEAVVMPYLHTLGRRRIHTLVVSHGDEDHAFGVADVMRRFPDARLVAGTGLSDDLQVLAEPCQAGMTWSHDNVHFSILHPGSTDTGSDNNRSCVMLVHHGASRALLTGDIEQAAERSLASRLGRFPVQLMTAPHHGSNTSSTAQLLSSLEPAHVVFPAGAGNRYGFPHSAVQLRYKLAGARQYVTGTLGAVSFSFNRSGLRGNPVTWWQTRRRFWHGFINPACSELFAGQALVLRGLELAHKGQALCGK